MAKARWRIWSDGFQIFGGDTYATRAGAERAAAAANTRNPFGRWRAVSPALT